MTPLQDRHRGSRLEMMKMWQLTERLALTEEQASKFFPRYNVLEKELIELGTEQKELFREMRKMMGEDKEVTDKELERITKKVSELEQQKIEKKLKFFEDLDEFLSPNQRARYLGFELWFKDELRRGLEERVKMGPPRIPGDWKKDMKRQKKWNEPRRW
jgi:Spy/CpxP family protein refolding chaperone|tara:strand:- start:272 stop:748 length:477 start_codon:yes stop_codon:yes gene_type:complete